MKKSFDSIFGRESSTDPEGFILINFGELKKKISYVSMLIEIIYLVQTHSDQKT